MLCVCVFAGVGVFDLYKHNVKVACVELVFAFLLLVYVMVVRMMRKRDMNTYMSMIVERGDSVSHNAVNMMPIPMTVLSVDGLIMWYNDPFVQMVQKEALYNVPVFELIKDIKWSEVLKSTDGIDLNVGFNSRRYRVAGQIIRNNKADPHRHQYQRECRQ